MSNRVGAPHASFGEKRARAAFLASAAALAAVAAGPAWADETFEERYADIADRLTVTGERRDYGLDKTSTATKTDTALVDIPQSIAVISRDLIDDQGLRSFGDVLRYVPGTTIGQGEGHRDAPVLRGNITTSGFFIDGVRDDVEYFRDLYNSERIEILKGPNSMIFGRGTGGGVINRVTKKADFEPVAALDLAGGSFGYGRAAIDIGAASGDVAAVRLNAVYENADSYRDFVGVERYGVNPTATWRLSEDTQARISYEYFHDARDVDRGVPSQNGRPYAGDRTAFFGNPAASRSEVDVHLATIAVDHRFTDALRLKSAVTFADYDKYYQNVHANSPVGPTGNVSLQNYFSGVERRNWFSQNDLTWEGDLFGAGHTILFGAEFGRQTSDNIRAANNNAAGVVNIAAPTTFAPPVFAGLQNDNRVRLNLAAVYLQDQIEIAPWLDLVGGVRFDHFDLDFDNDIAGGADFARVDNVVSPRGGVVFKPLETASVYASYTISFLPQSGDQFASLSATTAALEPERFENIEVGAKWDLRPGLSLTGALYRLERDNTQALDPDTNLLVLTGSQRSRGLELSLAGALSDRWQILAGYGWQESEITSTTVAAPEGRAVPLTPKHLFSLWNRYEVLDRVGVGVGVTHQTDSFTSISNAVTLPAYTRLDAALFLAVSERLELQLNVDNVLDDLFFTTAHNDNNITPGAPRMFRVSLKTRL